MDADARAIAAVKRYEQLAAARAPWENLWREIGELVLPRQADIGVERGKGERRHRLYDSFACGAMERFAAVMESALVPNGQIWHKLTTGDEGLDDDDKVKVYLEQFNHTLWRMRYSPHANFASQMHEHFMSLGAFGSGCTLVQEARSGSGFRYKQIHLGEVAVAENEDGIVDVVYRLFKMPARNIVRMWPETAPEKVRGSLEKEPDKEFQVVHCVKPREDYEPGNVDKSGMAFEGLYICLDTKTVLEEPGYHEQPYIFSRYVTTPRETYGRSPAMTLLATIKMMQAMAESNITAANFAVDPVIGHHDDAVLGAQPWRPGMRIPGAIDEDGRQLVQALSTGGDPSFGMEFIERERKIVDDGFMGVYFRVLLENPNMTATQALLIAQQQGQMAQPMIARQQSECLGQIIRRESAILHRQGIAPEPPDILVKYLYDTGQSLQIKYESPMVRAARSEAAVAALRTFEQLAPIAQVNPEIYKRFDMNALAKIIAEANGMPAEALLPDEALQEMEEQAEQQQMAAMALEAAPVAASAAKDLAQAQAAEAALPQDVGLWA